ncbi:MAG: hypothetical protein KGL39_52785 [Patescibacteria group bacterium]|nr:hypothetical protein [Patescibacteria group bacterium]
MGIPLADYHAMKVRLEKKITQPKDESLIVPMDIGKPGKRIRQDAKPLMNDLEQEWFRLISSGTMFANVRAQAKRFKLGNGIWYKPDISAICTLTGVETIWEVKGPHAFRGGFENLKIAAALYPEIDWLLVWKEAGAWKTQKILK